MFGLKKEFLKLCLCFLVVKNIEKLFLNGNFTCQPVWFGLTSRQIVAFRETNFKDNFKQDGGPK